MNLIGENKLDEKEFLQFFIKNIAPKLQDIENVRQEYLKKFKFRSYLIAPLIIAGIIASIYLYITNPDSDILNIMALVFLILSVPLVSVYNDYKKHVKKRLFNCLFQFCGDFYLNHNSLSKEEIKEYDFLPSFSRYKIDDCVKGKYNEQSISITELELIQGSGKNQHTTFDGLLCSFELNKNFKGKTIVVKDVGILNHLSGASRSEMKNIKLEDPVFEKEFEVYSTDQVEARYLLTTTFMERLLELREIFNANISCSFYNGYLALAVATNKNFFEPPNLFHKINEYERYKQIIIELYSIISVIDLLKLDQNIGM